MIRWAEDTFGDSIALAASFEDIVLIDLVTKVMPHGGGRLLGHRGALSRDAVLRRGRTPPLPLNLTVTKPGPEADAYPCGTEQCCQFRKVDPLRRALAGKRVWLTSLKRTDGPTRSDTPIVSWDSSFGLVKINPLATWTDQDIAPYLSDHGLPVHPLVPRGYRSIGCAPTTRPVSDGEDPRAAAGPASTSPSAACTSSAA